ncbi:hypothetical protein SAMN05660297_02104 [Natronincola peptidivorans]|uniref:SpoIIAA-like n=1 Tax=Natronincola peptidivorans TaxID=426128 RepID=A0A1I0DNZ2_9FIRM|nr:hypothetical protein [Natronincola peptidivorans]SET34266.1 hypothetical protein SAMN05660297_02104 [Natronincola peptidivorans]
MDNKAKYVISVVPGRKVVKSVANGSFTKTDVLNNIKDVVSKGKTFNGKWAFMPDITKMAPVLDPEVSEVLSKFHEEVEKAGGVAIAFIVEKAVAIKAQAQRHQNEANVNELVTNHFSSEEQALEWIKTLNI